MHTNSECYRVIFIYHAHYPIIMYIISCAVITPCIILYFIIMCVSQGAHAFACIRGHGGSKAHALESFLHNYIIASSRRS